VTAGEDVFFWVWCLLVANGGYPLPGLVFWDQHFSWFLPSRSLRNKDLEVKSLFFFHLGTFRRRLGLRDGRFCFLPALDHHFVPIKKSSLTRPRPGEGAFSCVMAFWAGTLQSWDRPEVRATQHHGGNSGRKLRGQSPYYACPRIMPIDRYGFEQGTFASPKGTPAQMRSLAPGTLSKPYSVYKVAQPITVKAGTTAPWFGQPGLGMQYELPSSIHDLVNSGALQRVPQ